jgi:nucleotide-binding universal stress UspA family protein
MKYIIVPVDFSEECLSGVQLALLFSRKTPVTIELVYVLQKITEHRPSTPDSERDYAEKQLNAMVAKFSPTLGKDSKLKYIIKKGRIYQEVVNQAQSRTDSIITASTHGASGFQEFFIGSNAYRIISATDRPVITIRRGNCPENISRIVLPVDNTIDSRQKVPYTIEMARLFHAEIHVVGIQTSKSEREVKRIRTYVGQVAGFIQGKVKVVTNEVYGDNVADMVVNYARSVKADMISITTEQGAGLSLIIGNTAHQLLNKSEIPILSQSPKKKLVSGGFSSSGG